jgi:hypothetical protein
VLVKGGSVPRRREGQPVENEQRVAVVALRLCNLAEVLDGPGGCVRFWVRDVRTELERIEPGAVMNDSTVNRVLNRLVSLGWMSAAWETADPGDRLSSKPRLYFRLTETGRAGARQIVADKRGSLPLWALYPAEVLGEAVEDSPATGVARGHYSAKAAPSRPQVPGLEPDLELPGARSSARLRRTR